MFTVEEKEKPFYVLVWHHQYWEFEKLLNKKHKEGYVCQGGMAVTTDLGNSQQFYQVMVLENGTLRDSN